MALAGAERLNRFEPSEIITQITELFNEGLLLGLLDGYLDVSELKNCVISGIRVDVEYSAPSGVDANPVIHRIAGATINFTEQSDAAVKATANVYMPAGWLVAILRLDDEDYENGEDDKNDEK